MSERRFLCIGGPLDGMSVTHGGRDRIDAVIPHDIGLAWSLGQRAYVADVLKTSYEIRDVWLDMPGLSVKGTVYLWMHAKDYPAQIMGKIVASLVPTRDREAVK